MRIELHIDRVVLDGIAPRHAGSVREALTAELGRLLASAPAGSWQHDRHTRRLATPPVAPSADPVRFGRGIAASVYGGIR
jgi:hypothetical protein